MAICEADAEAEDSFVPFDSPPEKQAHQAAQELRELFKTIQFDQEDGEILMRAILVLEEKYSDHST